MRIARTSILCAALAVSANAATLIHYYPFTADANDQAGTDNGTLIGDATISGGVLTLDGAGDYVDFAVNLIPGSGDFSVLMSARLNFVGAPAAFYETISQGASGSAFYIGSSTSGEVRVGDNWTSAYATYPTDGDWHVFAVTVDSVNDVTRLYIDGTQVSSTNIEIGHGGGERRRASGGSTTAMRNTGPAIWITSGSTRAC